MRRLVLVAAVLACVMLWLPAVARAAGDDDIPGTPMTLGQTVTGVVDKSTDPNDVYSIQLYEGQQVHFDATGPWVWYSLYGPGSVSIDGSHSFIDGWDTWSGRGQLLYTPARDGLYFIRVNANGSGQNYSCSVTRTDAPAITTPDTDDIFGLPIGLGSIGGVVDGITDPNDVYAVKLFEGEQFVLDASGPWVWIRIYGPGSVSIDGNHVYIGGCDTWSGRGQFVYTPAKDGVYFIRVNANGNGQVYTLKLSGSAEKPPYPSLLKLRSSAAQVKKGRTVTLSAALATPTGDLIGGQSVSLQSSTDGKLHRGDQNRGQSAPHRKLRSGVHAGGSPTQPRRALSSARARR